MCFIHVFAFFTDTVAGSSTWNHFLSNISGAIANGTSGTNTTVVSKYSHSVYIEWYYVDTTEVYHIFRYGKYTCCQVSQY